MPQATELTTTISIFFLCCSGDHLDLHSFPTRRSSDLGRIRFSQDELTLPAQRRTEVGMIGVEAIRFANHAAPPEAAFNIARFTATRASCTLYSLWLSGFASFTAASAAFCAVSSLTGCPLNACSASGEIHGTGAT